MRLICPNCDAEYEVDASVIPEAGRDVQCSNCGHTWFQMAPDLGPSLIDSADETALPPPSPAPSRSVAPPPASAVEDGDEDPEFEEAPSPAPVRSRPIEGSILSVLREEAARETAARRAEAPARIETQTDLDLPDPAPAAKRSVVPPVAAPSAAPPHGSAMSGMAAPRGDLLPDVEEINSTLRPVADRDRHLPVPASGAATGAGRGGFATGFFLMLTLACVLVALYGLAPRLSEQIPAAAPALDQFVAGVDGLRIWLDGVKQSAIRAIAGAD